MPFDWKTPVGYLFAVIWQSTVLFILFRVLSRITVPLAASSFLIALFFANDWKGNLQKLNEMAQTKQSEADISKQVTEFIHTHSQVRQLS